MKKENNEEKEVNYGKKRRRGEEKNKQKEKTTNKERKEIIIRIQGNKVSVPMLSWCPCCS